MFGITLTVESPKIKLVLRAMEKSEIPVLVKYWNSLKTHLNTKGLFGQTLENEIEWYDKTRKDPDSCTWAIQPEGETEIIGVTSLHGINSRTGSCSSGIVIFRQDWWNKGVASAAHLGRTLFAADYLSRTMIDSCVRTQNQGSYKALLRVGYSVWGIKDCSVFRANRWLETYHLTWYHPERIQLLFPAGVPARHQAGVENARLALQTARNIVKFP